MAVTGLAGTIMARSLLNLLRIRDPAVRGFAVGLTVHAIGTAGAIQYHETAGAFSASAVALNGIATASLTPFILKLQSGCAGAKPGYIDAMRKHLSETTGEQRLLYGGAAGLAVALLPWSFDGLARGLVGWCGGVAVYLLLAWWLAHSFDAERTRTRARSLDQPDLLILVSMLVVVGVSVVVIAMLLQQVKQMDGPDRTAHIALGLVALAGSWLMIHTIYAFHYAHRYYQNEKSPGDDEDSLDFPGREDPDYADFLYYAFVVGMTAQVSDVQVMTREMRRITLVHSVLSFAFNMLVLALSINVVAGAMG